MGALVVGLLLLAGAAVSRAEDSAATAATADEVLDSLKRTLAWSQQARAAMQTAREAAVVLAAREDERVLAGVVQRAFEAARAQARLVGEPASPSASPDTSNPAVRRAQRRVKLEAEVRDAERALARLRERARTAPPAQRQAVARETTAADNRLALARMRLDLLASLQQADAAAASGDPELAQQIQALQETVPELAPATTKAPPAEATAAAAATTPRADGTWSITHRLVSLQRARNSLAQLAWSTEDLADDVTAQAQRVRDALRERSRQLRTMLDASAAPKDGAVAIEADRFKRELELLKHLGAALVPLRAEAALLQRFQGDIRTWQRTVDRESRTALQELAIGLVGLLIALAAIAVGAIAWRVAANRYVKDPYRRRLALRARRIVIIVAVVLIMVFHFTSELTALVTALGFAAAGIAFALQNVILSIAGYFSMMAPSGIRVGDRVSVQGPFGYVHGDVLEIGLVRLRLRELTADRLEPTGRTVVFPNSVMFTGSFFKHPAAQAQAA